MFKNVTMSEKNIAVLYHGGCPDGFGGAYAAWKKFGDDADYIPMKYNWPVPEKLDGKELYFIDFDGIDAFSELIEQIRAQDKKVLIVQPSPLIVQMLMESKVYRELKGKGLVFDSVSSALAAKN